MEYIFFLVKDIHFILEDPIFCTEKPCRVHIKNECFFPQKEFKYGAICHILNYAKIYS